MDKHEFSNNVIAFSYKVSPQLYAGGFPALLSAGGGLLFTFLLFDLKLNCPLYACLGCRLASLTCGQATGIALRRSRVILNEVKNLIPSFVVIALNYQLWF